RAEELCHRTRTHHRGLRDVSWLRRGDVHRAVGEAEVCRRERAEELRRCEVRVTDVDRLPEDAAVAGGRVAHAAPHQLLVGVAVPRLRPIAPVLGSWPAPEGWVERVIALVRAGAGEAVV